MNKSFLFLFLLSLLIYSSAYAEDLFVRSAAGGEYGLEDGSDWDNAFDGFADISWGSGAGNLGPGDTLYISGGSSGETYAETLNIGASGTSESPITIKTGAAHPTQSSGHSGLVTITGVAGQNYGINGGDGAYDYVEIVGHNGNTGDISYINLKVANTGNTGVFFRDASKIKLSYIYAYECGDAKGDDGIDVWKATDGSEFSYLKVEKPYEDCFVGGGDRYPTGFASATVGCKVHHCIFRNSSDDLLIIDGAADIYENIIGPFNSTGYGDEGHPDGIFSWAGYLRIYNNTLIAGDYNTSTNSAMYITNADDRPETNVQHIYIYNNKLYGYGEAYTNGVYNAIDIDDSGGPNYGMDNIRVVNNTIVDWGNIAVNFETDDGDRFGGTNIIKNNIIYNCQTDGGGSVLRIASGIDYANSSFDIDDNLINAGSVGSNDIVWNGATIEVATFNAYTGQTGLVDPVGGRDNKTGTPTFVTYSAGNGGSNDLHLSSGDTAAIDNGQDLSALTNMDSNWPDDFEGDTRSTFDIGYDEYDTGDSTPPTISNVVISANGQNTTITWDEAVVTTGYDNGDCQMTCTNAGSVDLNSVSGSGDSRIFDNSVSVYEGDICTLACTAALGLGDDEIEDTSGNDMADVSGQAVTESTYLSYPINNMTLNGKSNCSLSGAKVTIGQ